MRWFVLLILLVLLVACEEGVSEREYSLEDSRGVAELYLLNAATYGFSGSNLELLNENALRCPNCYIFVFTFTSDYAGYGDRFEGAAEIETTHIANVIVQNGKVTQAIIDNSWNELTGKEVKEYELAVESEESPIPVYYCGVNRPFVCGSEREAVCSDTKIDYKNGCEACKRSGNKWYVKGLCDRGVVNDAITDIGQGKITTKSAGAVFLIAYMANAEE